MFYGIPDFVWLFVVVVAGIYLYRKWASPATKARVNRFTEEAGKRVEEAGRELTRKDKRRR